MQALLRRLRNAAFGATGDDPPDAELLGRFLTSKDSAAFELLVRRHGPMVFGVCRRVLGHAQDAEDAFQATFLVLARKAATVHPRAQVGNWLHGVSYRTALQARAAIALRRAKERHVSPRIVEDADPDAALRDLRPLLDEVLAGLSEKYRAPVVLCELEGRPRREVARQLGIPEGTLSSRLAKARRLLADRLAARGLVVSAAVLGTLLAREAAASKPGPGLAAGTGHFCPGGMVNGVLPESVTVLADGVIKTMFLAKLQQAGVLLLLLLGSLAAACLAPSGLRLAGGFAAGAGETRLAQRTGPAKGGAEGEEKKVHVELTEVGRPPAPDGALIPVTAALELDRTQPAGPGLRFRIVMLNRAKKVVSYANPLDSLQVLVTDREGWPLALPPALPRGLVDSVEPAERAMVRLPFRHGPVTLDGRILAKAETEQQNITLPPDGKLVIHGCIDRVGGRVSAEGRIAAAPEELAPIPAGTYRVQAALLLQPPDDAKGRRLQSKFAQVRLGE